MSGSDQDSWDEEEPGVPSMTSSPVGSQHGSESGSSQTDVEEEEIMSEFRELRKSIVTTTSIYNYSTESLDSSSFEDVEKLKERLHSLKRYVFELKESYDELLRAFSLLETGSKLRVGELERELSNKISQAKVVRSRVESLQSQLSQAQAQIAQVQEANERLSTKNAVLAGENADLLQQVQEGEMAERDLGQVLQVVSDGVRDGNMKLSQLTLQSQDPPFPVKDLVVQEPVSVQLLQPVEYVIEKPVQNLTISPQREHHIESSEAARSGSASPVERPSSALEKYESELAALRGELDSRLTELQRLRDELAAVRAEGEASADALRQSRRELEETEDQRNQLQVQLAEAKESVSGLRNEVTSLTAQLREAMEKQTALSQALQDTREAMELYQTTAKQEVEHRDQELAQLTVELSTLEQRRQSLENQVTHSQTQVQSLEEARQQAQQEITSLQDEVQRLEEAVQDSSLEEEGLQETLAEKGVELEAVKEEKNALEKQLEEKVKELQTQIAETQALKTDSAAQVSNYQDQLSSLQTLHTQCRDEAEKMRALLESKEGELSRMLTVLQVAAAQIAALDGRDGARSPAAVSEELSQCEGACQALEAELTDHRKKWEESVVVSEQHRVSIDELTARQAELEEEVTKREQRVAELEALLAEVNSSQASMSQTVADYEESLAALQRELESTQAQFKQNCEEMAILKDELTSSAGALEDKEQLLVSEVQKRDALIQSLETDERALKERCEKCTERAQIAEKAQDALQQEYDRVAEELEAREREVAELEKEMEGVGTKGREEVERCQQLIDQLRAQLEESQEKCQTSHEQAVSAEDELGALQGEHARLTEQLALREEVLKQLEDKTAHLKQQHLEALDDINCGQQLVETLQEELASSQGLSDGLQHEVSECEREIQELQESLYHSEQERVSLQEQVKNLEHDLAALQEDLSAERDHSSTLAQSSESTLQGVRQEMGGLKATLDRSQAQNDLLEKTVEEQRTELVELRLKVSDLELHKESLLFQSSTNESTIASLRGQLSTVESALQDTEEKCSALEEDLRSSHTHSDLLESQLAKANENLEDMERTKVILEGVGSERLSEITQLHRQLEEERVNEGLVRELGEQIASLEKQLTNLQSKHDAANTKAMEADRACVALETANAQQQILISQMELDITEFKGQAEDAEGLRDQLADLDEQLARLHTELEVSKDECLSLQAQNRTVVEKEVHWSKELAETATQLRLAEERVGQLEREGRGREIRIRELEARLVAAQKLGTVRQEEASESRGLVTEFEKQLSDKQQDILHLQHLLDCCRGDLESVRGQLSSSEDTRRGLLQRLRTLEDEMKTVTREHSQVEVELAGARASLAQKNTEQATGAGLADQSDRIREQQTLITSLRTEKQELELRIQELQSQLVTADPLSSRDSSSTSLPSITRLRAQVDLDITTGGAEVTATTTSIPLTFDSKYRAAMEKGLSSASVEPPLRCGGSETESEAAALGKDYWVRRAGELSVQLQQSSEYWTQKVRELSIELEKCKQAHRRID